MDKENIDELIAGFLSKAATPEEEKQLLSWVEASDDNRRHFKQMYQVWLGSAQCGQLEAGCVEQALQRVRRKAFEMSVVEKRLQDRKAEKRIIPAILRYAAAVALFVTGSFALIHYYYVAQHLASFATEMTYEAHYGSRAYATLPDGSEVWLNSGSKLTVQSGYNHKERTVELSGEAYFVVNTSPEKPFIVKAGELSIKATGTAFNVKAYPEEEQIITTLVEGTVFIVGSDDNEKRFQVELKPNQTVSYSRRQTPVAPEEEDDAIAVSSGAALHEEQDGAQPPLMTATTSIVKTETLTSWRKDRWIIDNEEFGNIAVQLERRYNVEIRFESQELKRYRFTGTIERETVEQMFNAFRYAIPLKYTIERGVITLTLDMELKQQYEKAWIR